MTPKGKIYIVAGPIGNLDDITLRALEVLRNVDVVVSEDTRETSKLLDRYSIHKSQISYRDQNHLKAAPLIIEELKKGRNLALLSDSGTPLISDPGFKLIKEIIQNGFMVVPVPGPSAFIPALVASGLPTDKFIFLGFLPKSTKQKKEILQKCGHLDATLIIYESPYRLEKLFKEIYEAIGDRYICLASEITKMHERFKRGKVTEIAKNFKKEKGEHVVLVAKEGFKYD